MNEDAPSRSPDGYLLNVKMDVPDIRDRPYEPALLQLAPEIPPPRELNIRDQGEEGACTGFGLAAVIDFLNARRGNRISVSARMLYEMARYFDEWPGEEYSGSSCRGAIRGWRNMGVCTEKQWQYEAGDRSVLTVERAKAAWANTLGAYYRMRREIADFHAALNEAGVLYVSADVHTGWSKSNTRDGRIPYQGHSQVGGHAFAVVGYNDEGFWVQNSWGPNWGDNGVALWHYEDWHENVRDAWVVGLALSTPQIFALPPSKYDPALRKADWLFDRSPSRTEIAGHFVHIDDGRFHPDGRYGSERADVIKTAQHLVAAGKYHHLLFYAHGGLNRITDSARRISAMKEVFKANGIYPFHFMYDTGLLEEIKDIVLSKKSESVDRVGAISDYTDKFIEYLTRRPGRALWREMKGGARKAFFDEHAGIETLQIFTEALVEASPAIKIHLAGHSTGGIFIAHLLDALRKINPSRSIASCSLMAPACTTDLFRSHYLPYVGQTTGSFSIRNMVVYNLTDQLERDDNVADIYNKSLLYLVSNAYEDNIISGGIPLLGMQKFSGKLDFEAQGLTFVYSRGQPTQDEARSTSVSHGGFDNDPFTMNDILKNILGYSPSRPFTKEDLQY